MTEQQIRNMIASATTQADLGSIWTALQEWLKNNPARETVYNELLNAYDDRYAAIVSGGGGTTATSPGLVAEPQAVGQAGRLQALGEEAPFAAWMRQFGLPAAGQTPFQQWQERQFEPAYAAYTARGALSPAGQEATPWSNYLVGLGLGGQSSAAYGALGQAGGLKPQEQRRFAEQLGATPGAPTGGQFGDLLKGALAYRYPTRVAARMGQWLPGLEQQYQAGLPGEEGSFLNYLRRYLRL